MTARGRKAILFAVMLTLLGIAAVWNADWMLGQRAEARAAAGDLAECRRIAGEIEHLRARPAVASSEDIGVQELGKRIEAASRQAGLGDRAVEGVFPQSTRRVGDTPYLAKPTALTLRGVSLGQLAAFLHRLTDDSRLSVRDLRLRTPHGEATGSAWDVEATVTYLIYAPLAKERRD